MVLSPDPLPLISFNSLRPFSPLFFLSPRPCLPSADALGCRAPGFTLRCRPVPAFSCLLGVEQAAFPCFSLPCSICMFLCRAAAGGILSLLQLDVKCIKSVQGAAARAPAAQWGARAGSLLLSPRADAAWRLAVFPALPGTALRGLSLFPLERTMKGSSLPPATPLAAAACSLAVFPALRRAQKPRCGPALLEGWVREAGTWRRGQGFPKPLCPAAGGQWGGRGSLAHPGAVLLGSAAASGEPAAGSAPSARFIPGRSSGSRALSTPRLLQ